MPKFLHIAFNWTSGLKVEELTPEFNKAKDWVRYAPNCWIVWTTSDMETWYARVRPYMKNEDYVFICEINLKNRQGWLPKFIWDWINKPRT